MKPKSNVEKVQIAIRITERDRLRFRKVMKDRHIEYETQLARMIILEYLDKYLGDKK